MPRKLGPDELYRCCEPSEIGFETTAEISPAEGTIGQERAMRAMEFGLSLESKGFNIFTLGESGTGKMTSVMAHVKKLASGRPVPSDWCYVYNFDEPDVPRAVALPPGRALEFQQDMQEMVNVLKSEVPRVFEAKEYEKSKSRIVEEFQKRQKDLLSSLEEEARDKGFSIRKTVSGLVVVPMVPSGEPLTEEEFEKLDAEHKGRIEEIGRQLQEKLDDVVRAVRKLEKDIKNELEKLERDAALAVVGHYIDDLKAKYGAQEKVSRYLDDVMEDMLDSLDDFKSSEEQPSPLPFLKPQKAEPSFTRYTVNVLVNNASTAGAPCIYEANPTYSNLFGRTEHKFQYGMATTDFSMIKAGALHRANGGYLIVDALDLLRNIFSYEALKRSLRQKEVKMEDMWEQYKTISSSALKPEPVPLDVKVILIGSPNIYYLLYNLDEEYKELFKVKADFESAMPRQDYSIRKYAEFIAAKCSDEKLLHFDRTGVARVIEYGSRLAGHQEKLSSKFSQIADLVREAHHWATRESASAVTSAHVVKALDERVYRSNRIEERMQEMMTEGTIIVETSGKRIGQVNGLAVLSMGDYSFGKPSRITAVTFAGKSGLVNIERETKMSGRIHEKAILIISNYIGNRYGRKKPVTLSASLTFEQLYDMVEGDSATCAELYALLSSLSGLPIRQDIAVTGSMDQNGDVQPIGGVNEKIEGFYELCKARGLDSSHGVIIPSRNIRHLMIKDEVVSAVREGRFSIYPIDRMEQGMEILCGLPAGEPGPDGAFPEGTFNALVVKRLEEIDKAMKPDKGRSDNGEEGSNPRPDNDKGCGACG